MPSIKQIEAFYWSATLGSLVNASRHLNTTQSNVSKRILEMEARLNVELFDRSNRKSVLTLKGREILKHCEELLNKHHALKMAGESDTTFSGPFRFGVLESVAMTWLPRLVDAIRDSYPGLEPKPEVSGMDTLLRRLHDREIDMVIGTRPSRHEPDFGIHLLTEMDLVWVSSPSLVDTSRRYDLEQLVRLPLISHHQGSAGQAALNTMLGEAGLTANYTMSCNTLIGLGALVVSGMGVTFVPRPIFRKEIESGVLAVLDVDPPLPRNSYCAIHHLSEISTIPDHIAELAERVCTFEERLPISVLS